MPTMTTTLVPAVYFPPPRMQPDHSLIATEALSHINPPSDFPQPILSLANTMPYYIATYISTYPNQASILDYLKTQLPTIHTLNPEYIHLDREDVLCAIILAPLKPNIEPLLLPTGAFPQHSYLKFKSQAVSSWQRILSTQTPKFKQHEPFFSFIHVIIQRQLHAFESKPTRTKRQYNRTKPVDRPLKKPRTSMEPQQPQPLPEDEPWVLNMVSPPASPLPPPMVLPEEMQVSDQDQVTEDLFQFHMSDEDLRFFDSIMQNDFDGPTQYVNDSYDLDRRTDTVVSLLSEMSDF